MVEASLASRLELVRELASHDSCVGLAFVAMACFALITFLYKMSRGLT